VGTARDESYLYFLDTTGLQAASISIDNSVINASCFFAGGSSSRGCQILLEDSTLLLNISLTSGEVLAMGTARFTPGIVTGNILAVEILENGSLSYIRILLNSFVPTTQLAGVCVIVCEYIR